MNAQETHNQDVQAVIGEFWKTVPPLWHYTRAAIHRTVKEDFGITATQYHVLRRIKESGPKTVSELSECMFISRPGISRAVDELANEGLIKRERDEHDRRVVYLSASVAGKRVMEKIFEKNNLFMEEFFSSLDDRQLATVSEAFEILQHRLDQNSSAAS
jgi:DNA-binding MarR family transcriptional regulator